MRPEDDYTHPVGAEANFNESMYFHFYDPNERLGGFVRLANRPNEGRGEMTVCLYLPDGEVAFSFGRPEVSSNDRFDAARLRFVVREPMRRHKVSYCGDVFLIHDPSALSDPRTAFRSSPQLPCALELDITATAPASAHTFETAGGAFAPNHYEQLLSARGRLRVGRRVVQISGHGLRDHSWGPRHWQAPWFYRWVHGAAEDFGFMGAWFGQRDGSALRGGFVWDGDTLSELDSLEIASERDDRDEQVAMTVVLRSAGREWKLDGTVLAKVPLRHRREAADGVVQTTRIVEGLTKWALPDGRVLHGMSEYLDQIVEGRPAGLGV
ncbi:hypothetical protein FPZ12_003440 [Amycolatopsis acidicola]|uniref:DUF2804 domain-containing protein n=1 Tax=Amycolatopsis acidicola TaxID=2596893 RepID=A0A5N0VI08_9PSEU|nr:hypothetical protein [Amycolatopsis acidicola]KAA9166017.1 hypothetical protein FPZ12_003440 [Amycolatopsis acidicola]